MLGSDIGNTDLRCKLIRQFFIFYIIPRLSGIAEWIRRLLPDSKQRSDDFRLVIDTFPREYLSRSRVNPIG